MSLTSKDFERIIIFFLNKIQDYIFFFFLQIRNPFTRTKHVYRSKFKKKKKCKFDIIMIGGGRLFEAKTKINYVYIDS